MMAAVLSFLTLLLTLSLNLSVNLLVISLIFSIFLLTYKDNLIWMNMLLVQKVHEVTALLLVLNVEVLFYIRL